MLALGATRWEMIRIAVLRNARIGIVGGIILGLGRALGETMAVTMVIGNNPQIVKSLFAPGYTLASVIANEFTEATGRSLPLRAHRNRPRALPRHHRGQHHRPPAGLGRYPRHARHEPLTPCPPCRNLPARYAPAAGTPFVRYTSDHAITAISVLGTLLVLVPLIAILGYLIFKGASSLNLAFFTQVPKPVGETGGGMANSIVGSMVILSIASAMGIPIGIAGGVYLAEYGAGTWLGAAIRFVADVLNGVPSIVMGIAGYALIVVYQHHFSALAAGVTLAIMMVPTVTRTTEEMLLTVPHAIREAAYGLGVPRWRTVMSISLRTAAPGIITGCMLAFARIAGETAPLLFTAFGSQFWPHSLNEPIAALPLQIFVYAMSPYDEVSIAWPGPVRSFLFP